VSIAQLLGKTQIWVGAEYYGLMILGEGTYGGITEGTLCMDYYLLTDGDDTLRKICNAVTGLTRINADLKEERRDFWKYLLFYNFVFQSRAWSNVRPGNKFRDPANVPMLKAVLAHYGPAAVWILGNAKDGHCTARYAKPVIAAAGIPCLVSRHPARQSYHFVRAEFEAFVALSGLPWKGSLA